MGLLARIPTPPGPTQTGHGQGKTQMYVVLELQPTLVCFNSSKFIPKKMLIAFPKPVKYHVYANDTLQHLMLTNVVGQKTFSFKSHHSILI